VDLSDRAEKDRPLEAQRLVVKEAQRSFDLSCAPLLRSLLLRLGDREHVLLVTMHHIAADGWSLEIFLRELTALYDAFAAGKSSPLAALPIQYPDYAAWQRKWLQGTVLEEQSAYWKQQLAGVPPKLELPAD